MAFVRSNSPKYHAPASINTLSEGGQLVANKFDIQVRRLTKTQLKELDERIKAWDPADTANRDRAVLAGVMTGWRAVQDADGKELPFTLEALDQLEEEHPGFVRACVEAFYLSTQPTQAAHLAAKN
jgi:hypothetical protein